MDLNSMTHPELEEEIKKTKIAILPIGAIEAHGPHLPLGTDNYLAERLAQKVAEKIEAFVLPTFAYGQVWSLRNVKGSINISNEHLKAILVDIGTSLYRFGIRLYVIINGHFGNNVAIKEAARELYEKIPELKVYYFFYPGVSYIIDEVRESEPLPGGYFHACEIETSYMLYLAPEHVQMEKAINDTPNLPEDFEYTPTPWDRVTSTVVMGNAALATKEKGEKIINVAIDNIVKILKKWLTTKEGV
ncbi:creatininase family protein [Thermoanaerobacter uzonensis]|uniref:creatininase family protein n=1 Tax=Thermoanaerobacter uzonensis TaxID=447593 RepID=UPI003D768DA1